MEHNHFRTTPSGRQQHPIQTQCDIMLYTNVLRVLLWVTSLLSVSLMVMFILLVMKKIG